jgi:hypothetical protein
MFKLTAYLLLASFLAVAIFGVSFSVPSSHRAAGYDRGCPFEAGCVTLLEHLEHWKSAFTAIEAEFIVFFAVLAFVVTLIAPAVAVKKRLSAWRRRSRLPIRPPLLQELFSQGILNRKEPLFVR